MNKRGWAIAGALLVIAALLPAQALAAPKLRSVQGLSFAVKQTPAVSSSTPLITLYGKVRPARAGVSISVQVYSGGRWRETRLTAKTTPSGTWSIRQPIEALSATISYRAIATYRGQRTLSAVNKVSIKPSIIDASYSGPLIETLGPGGRIWGMDISRWDHPNGAPIDFTKMYSAGVRFVIIKSSDTYDRADALARQYMPDDRIAAHAAGIYTGFYHYAYMPNTTNSAAIIADAKAQAEKAIWRLASVGGYTERDLPYALDLEDSCVAKNSAGVCTARATKQSATLWALTWLETMKQRTGRTPIFYSYPSFIQTNLLRDPAFRQYPLWLAHYGVSPYDPTAFPGQKIAGCFVHPWTQGNCTPAWTIWQYSSCGKATDFGVRRDRVDLNVFRGGPEEFLALTSGTWTPEEGDFLPQNEPTVINAGSITASTTDSPVVIPVDVLRETGLPVVTGSLSFSLIVPEGSTLPTPILSATRSAVGTWTLRITGVPAGTWDGVITFRDSTGVHAKSTLPVSFTLLAGIKPLPTAKPTPVATSTPQPTATVTAKPAPISTKPLSCRP
jgi:lysozyme